MKHIKNLKDFWRGDIIKNLDNKLYNNLYIIIDDVFESDKNIKAFHIGHISTNFSNVKYCNLIFNTNKANIVILANKNVYPLDDEDKNLFYNAVDEPSYKKYMNIIYDKTKINIKDTLEYKEYLFKKNINKYNI